MLYRDNNKSLSLINTAQPALNTIAVLVYILVTYLKPKLWSWLYKSTRLSKLKSMCELLICK
jgi:hypothetical protein